MKISERIKQVTKQFPKRHAATGFLYKGRYPATTKFDEVMMYAVFVSNLGESLMRPHLYGPKQDMTPAQWAAWFRKHHKKIVNNIILPAYAQKFGGLWRLHTVIGFSKHDSDKIRVSVVGSKKRNKAKRARKRNVHRSLRG